MIEFVLERLLGPKRFSCAWCGKSYRSEEPLTKCIWKHARSE